MNRRSETRVSDPDVYVPVVSTGSAANPQPQGTWDEVTYRAVLEHDLRDDVLSYASFATGFQSAYYNMANTSANPPLAPVTVDAYEVGVKTMLFDSRLRANASLFLYNVDNVVVSRNIGGTQSLSNAAASRYRGIDVDLTLRATQNLTLSTAFEYLDPEYTDYRGNDCLCAERQRHHVADDRHRWDRQPGAVHREGHGNRECQL